MFTRLLVGFDGSPASRVALEQAIGIGRKFRATIILARIPAPGPQPAASPDRVLTGAGARCALGPQALPGPSDDQIGEAMALVNRAGLRAELAETPADPVWGLHNLATTVDLLFVGRGDGGRDGSGGGSTDGPDDDPVGSYTRDIIQIAPVPVMVCGTEATRFERCAVAVGDGPTDRRALALAARYAGITGARLDLLLAAPESAGESRADDAMAEAASILSEPPVRFEIHPNPGGADRHHAIAEAVDRLGCDGLFVGGMVTGRRLSVPSHTEAILRATDIPVLVHN